MERRRLLAAVGTGLAGTAGCLSALDRKQGVKYTLEMSRISADVVEVLPVTEYDELDSDEKRVVRAVAAGGTYRSESPHLSGDFVSFEGSHFRISVDGIDRENNQWTVWVEPASSDRDAVEHDDLPAVDRDAVAVAVRLRRGEAIEDPPDAENRYAYPDDVSGSVLVPERERDYVAYDGETYRVRTASSRVGDRRYAHTAERFDDAAALRDAVVLGFDDAGLSDGERDVLDEATEEGSYTEGYVNWDDVSKRTVISDGFKSVIQRLRDHVDIGGRFNVVDTYSEYRGTTYRTGVTADSSE